jgi:hypothetical protein
MLMPAKAGMAFWDWIQADDTRMRKASTLVLYVLPLLGIVLGYCGLFMIPQYVLPTLIVGLTASFAPLCNILVLFTWCVATFYAFYIGSTTVGCVWSLMLLATFLFHYYSGAFRNMRSQQNNLEGTGMYGEYDHHTSALRELVAQSKDGFISPTDMSMQLINTVLDETVVSKLEKKGSSNGGSRLSRKKRDKQLKNIARPIKKNSGSIEREKYVRKLWETATNVAWSWSPDKVLSKFWSEELTDDERVMVSWLQVQQSITHCCLPLSALGTQPQGDAHK